MAIIGASGSGKSTLMNILGCLDRPVRGATGSTPGDRQPVKCELASLRRDYFGFIFQRYHPAAPPDRHSEYRDTGHLCRRKQAFPAGTCQKDP